MSCVFQESNKGSAMRRYDVDLRGFAIHLQWRAEASYKSVYSWLVAALPSKVHDSWTLQVRTDDELFVDPHTSDTFVARSCMFDDVAVRPVVGYGRTHSIAIQHSANVL
jgi:hypothetical protein